MMWRGEYMADALSVPFLLREDTFELIFLDLPPNDQILLDPVIMPSRTGIFY
jgi:hypothetical protein